jgi:hypothetical protein
MPPSYLPQSDHYCLRPSAPLLGSGSFFFLLARGQHFLCPAGCSREASSTVCDEPAEEASLEREMPYWGTTFPIRRTSPPESSGRGFRGTGSIRSFSFMKLKVSWLDASSPCGRRSKRSARGEPLAIRPRRVYRTALRNHSQGPNFGDGFAPYPLVPWSFDCHT